MKLRLRLKKRTVVVTVEDAANLDSLRQTVISQFNISDFALSLNGRDPLQETDSKLADLGIVSGDLILVLSDEDPPPAQAAPKPKLLAGTSNTLQTERAQIHTSEQKAESEMRDHPQPSTSKDTTAHTSSETGANAMPMTDEIPMDVEGGLEIDTETNRYLCEPMSVRESTESQVPYSLESMYYETAPPNPHEALALVLHVLMTEVGFQTQNATRGLPDDWKKPAKYEVHYIHAMCPDRSFRLTMMPLASLLVVYGSVHGATETVQKQLQLETKKFVKEIKPSALNTFKDLPKLSKMFKDSVAYAIFQSCREEMELPSVNSLTGMITELKMLILQYLDFQSLAHLGQTCKELYSASRDPALWRKLYLRRFAKRSDNSQDQDWFQHYKERHLAVVAYRRQMRHMTMVVPPIIDRPHPPFPFNPPVYPPGVIGGDYDLNPPVPGAFGQIPNPLRPRPRFDPIGPLPNQRFPPGRGGGIWEGGGLRIGRGGLGSLFF